MSELVVIKHNPDGRPPFRYAGEPVESPEGWIAVRAGWPLDEVVVGPVRFLPGDILNEFFSLNHPYNAMAIFRATGEFGGWYCNVTHPTTFRDGEIHWHDLYIDVLVSPDGQIVVEDEDELDASGLAQTEPQLYDSILAARDELIELIERNAYPFCTVSD